MIGGQQYTGQKAAAYRAGGQQNIRQKNSIILYRRTADKRVVELRMTKYWPGGWRNIMQEGSRAEDDRVLDKRVEGYWTGGY